MKRWFVVVELKEGTNNNFVQRYVNSRNAFPLEEDEVFTLNVEGRVKNKYIVDNDGNISTKDGPKSLDYAIIHCEKTSLDECWGRVTGMFVSAEEALKVCEEKHANDDRFIVIKISWTNLEHAVGRRCDDE